MAEPARPPPAPSRWSTYQTGPGWRPPQNPLGTEWQFSSSEEKKPGCRTPAKGHKKSRNIRISSVFFGFGKLKAVFKKWFPFDFNEGMRTGLLMALLSGAAVVPVAALLHRGWRKSSGPCPCSPWRCVPGSRSPRQSRCPQRRARNPPSSPASRSSGWHWV